MTLLWLLASIALVLGLRKVLQWRDRRGFSSAWFRQIDRASWSQGIDAPCWRWPVVKD